MSGSTGLRFSLEETQKAVRAMNSSKPPGADGVDAEALKAGGEKMTKTPMKLCNAWIGADVSSTLYKKMLHGNTLKL